MQVSNGTLKRGPTYFPSHPHVQGLPQVKEEFPDLEIHSDSVKVDAFGYQATWKVGPDAANLMEAATMAQRVLRAGTAQFRKLESLKR